MVDYVDQIGESDVHVIAHAEANIVVIQYLGGNSALESENTWRINYDNEDQLALILQSLRNADILFAHSPTGWPPSGVFDYLLEKGKVRGKVRRISWMSPGQHVILD